MKLRQRSQQVFEAIRKGGKRSIRKIASATGMAKSSVHRHKQALERRNKYPESPWWETSSGQQWLRRLIFSTIYVFGIKCGIGAETLSEFFQLLQLPLIVGVSPRARAETRSRGERGDTQISTATALNSRANPDSD